MATVKTFDIPTFETKQMKDKKEDMTKEWRKKLSAAWNEGNKSNDIKSVRRGM